MSAGSFPLESLRLSSAERSALEKCKLVSALDILLTPPAELNRRLRNRDLKDTYALVRKVAEAIRPLPRRLNELYAEQRGEARVDGAAADEAESRGPMFLGTGDEGIDQALGGGLRLGSLTEIAGESASGKSHLCLKLALAAQLPQLCSRPGGIIILASEREISTDRLTDLARQLLTYPDVRASTSITALLDNIRTAQCPHIEALENMLTYKIPPMLAPPANARGQAGPSTAKGPLLPVRLLVIDSITALLRGADSHNNSSAGLAARARHITAIADRLKTLAEKHQIAVVVINQVSDVFDEPRAAAAPTLSLSQTASQTQPDLPTQPPSSGLLRSAFGTGIGADPPMSYRTQARWFSGQSPSLRKEASLGLVWANAVNTRLMLSRTGRRRLLDPDTLRSIGRKRPPVDEDEEGGQGARKEETQPTLIRRLHVVFSSHAAPAYLDYVITPLGIQSLADSYKPLDNAEAIKRYRELQAAGQADKPEEEDGPGGSQGGTQVLLSEDEFGDEVFDDLGDLPAEYWEAEAVGLGQEGGVT